MPARDLYHDVVRNALRAEGWTITHDPYILPFGRTRVFIDLGGERLLGAERGAERIAVEVKTFGGPSEMKELEQALGQFVFYRALLHNDDPERRLYLAIPVDVYDELFALLPTSIATDIRIAYALFDPTKEVIVRWMT